MNRSMVGFEVEASGRPLDSGARWTRSDLVVLAALMAVATIYLFPLAIRGWIPVDDGTLALSAERAAAGEVPHRDFETLYTGGLSLLHGAVFRFWAPSILTLRLFLLAATLCAIVPMFWIARHFAGPSVAAGVVALGLVWSVPVHFSAMPTWYVLFLALGNVACWFRAWRKARGGWLLAAGLTVGLAILVKQIGLYLLAANLLLSIYEDQDRRFEAMEGVSRAAAATIILGLGAYLLAVGALVSRVPGLAELLLYLVPNGAVVWVLVRREGKLVRFGRAPASVGRRWRVLIGSTAPLLVGVALPLVVFSAWYLRLGAGGELLAGVASVGGHLDALTTGLPPAWQLSAGLLPALPWLLSWLGRGGEPSKPAAWLLAGGLTVVVLFGALAPVYRTVWLATRACGFALGVVGGVWLAKETEHPCGRQVFALVSMAAVFGLTGIPSSLPVYFAYTAPLVFLAYLGLWRVLPGVSDRAVGLLLVFLLAFGGLWVDRGWRKFVGQRFVPVEAYEPLSMPKGGIEVGAPFGRVYVDLVRQIQLHSPAGAPILVYPVAPEIYFLADRRNPTRSLFDRFDSDLHRDGGASDRLALVDELDLEAVVLSDASAWAGPIEMELVDGLRARFPNWIVVGPFEVRWR